MTIQECPPPCQRMEIKSRMESTKFKSFNAIRLMFKPSVQVTRSVLTIPLINLVSNLGGLMGMFLGVSLLQTINLVDFIKNRITSAP